MQKIVFDKDSDYEHIKCEDKSVFVEIRADVSIKNLQINKHDEFSELEIKIGKNSLVNLHLFEVLGGGVGGSNINMYLEDYARLNGFILSCGGNSQIKVKSHLANNCCSNIDSVFYINGTQELMITVENLFKSKCSQGEINIKGVLDDMSKANVEGIISILRNGEKTDAYLKEDLIILNDKARVNAIPALNIDTNDVRASHGVTVSQVNKEMIFYAESKGIKKQDAQKMIVTGFLDELLQKYTIPSDLREKFLRV